MLPTIKKAVVAIASTGILATGVAVAPPAQASCESRLCQELKDRWQTFSDGVEKPKTKAPKKLGPKKPDEQKIKRAVDNFLRSIGIEPRR